MKKDDLSERADLIARRPDMTLRELADALSTPVSVPTVFRAAEKLKLPLKKVAPAGHDRPDVKAARAVWF